MSTPTLSGIRSRMNDDELINEICKDLPRIYQDRDQILELIEQWIGEAVTASTARYISYQIQSGMGWPNSQKAIEATIMRYAGVTLPYVTWRQLAWQFASNVDDLQHDRPLLPFSVAHRAEWVAMDIIGISDKSTGSQELYEFEFRALSGLSAGFTITQKMSPQALFYMARHLGFSHRTTEFDGNPLMLFGLYFVGFIDDLRIERFACPDRFIKLNRKITRMRRRDVVNDELGLDNYGNPKRRAGPRYGCPDGFEHPCWECEIKRSGCKAGY